LPEAPRRLASMQTLACSSAHRRDPRRGEQARCRQVFRFAEIVLLPNDAADVATTGRGGAGAL